MKSLLLTGAALLLAAGAAAAQPGPPPGQSSPPRADRPKIDADNDGKITWAEFQGAQTARFTLRDVDKDGRIAKDERPAGRQGMKQADGGPRGFCRGRTGRGGRGGPGMMGPGMMFDRSDQNDDGFVTKAEMDTAAKRLFTYLDLNNDGVLSGKELPAPGQGGRGGPRGPGGPDAPPHSGKPD